MNLSLQVVGYIKIFTNRENFFESHERICDRKWPNFDIYKCTTLDCNGVRSCHYIYSIQLYLPSRLAHVSYCADVSHEQIQSTFFFIWEIYSDLVFLRCVKNVKKNCKMFLLTAKRPGNLLDIMHISFIFVESVLENAVNLSKYVIVFKYGPSNIWKWKFRSNNHVRFFSKIFLRKKIFLIRKFNNKKKSERPECENFSKLCARAILACEHWYDS